MQILILSLPISYSLLASAVFGPEVERRGLELLVSCLKFSEAVEKKEFGPKICMLHVKLRKSFLSATNEEAWNVPVLEAQHSEMREFLE